jgi:hypothetical protein
MDIKRCVPRAAAQPYRALRLVGDRFAIVPVGDVRVARDIRTDGLAPHEAVRKHSWKDSVAQR